MNAIMDKSAEGRLKSLGNTKTVHAKKFSGTQGTGKFSLNLKLHYALPTGPEEEH